MFHRHNNSGCDVPVDRSASGLLWHNVKQGDQRVELWCWKFHLWADTKDKIVCQGDELRDLLIAEGMDEHTASRVVDGNFRDLPPVNQPQP